MIRNIILDIGNVLGYFQWAEIIRKYLDADDECFAILEEALMKSGMWYEFDRGVKSDEEIINAVIERAPQYEDKIHVFFRHLDEIVLDYDYASPWITDLRARGYKVYLLSNYGETAFRECCRYHLRFVKLVDGMVISYEIKKVKPNPEIYNELLSRYGLVPSECLFFDDLPANVEGARAVGMNACVFTSYEKACEDLAGYEQMK